jgi:hypothetical protein
MPGDMLKTGLKNGAMPYRGQFKAGVLNYAS